MSRTALIAGAGIGGLSAAIALRRTGWSVRVFERAQSPRELGFGVGLAPNAIAALRELGMADQVLARSFEPRSVEVRRPDGTVVKRVELPPGSLGGPMVVALRPALHGALLDAVGSDSITLDWEATGFDMRDGRVTLRAAQGGVVEGDLLVGADGVASSIRRALHPSEPPPKTCGVVAVRGAVQGVLHHLNGLSAIFYMGRGIESMVIRASDTGIYWFLSLARALVPTGMSDPAAILARMSPQFDVTFRAVTSATADMRCDELVDRDPIPFWGTGLVTLLGDAAHPVLPQTGQGAAQAIVDAVALAQALESGLDVERALRAYEHDRRGKTAALLRQGRRTASVMKTTNALACYLREVALRAAPVNTLARFYTSISRHAGTDVSRGRKS
ncbi:MAG TPA: FAD-dependent monooxygenase [Vicinamibacterales bacterium]|nr:FAD-dependent monooxygenase [Vicinamibacterales bacterium]